MLIIGLGLTLSEIALRNLSDFDWPFTDFARLLGSTSRGGPFGDIQVGLAERPNQCGSAA